MQTNFYKILIAEDDTFSRKGIETVLLELQLNVEIGQVKNGQEALEYLSKNKVDILLTDINMQPINGLELSKTVRNLFPEIKIIIITGFITMEYIKPLSELNVEGIIYKNNGNIDDMQNALTLVKSGNKFRSNHILKFIDQMNLLSSNNSPILTEIEKKALTLLADGVRFQQIADRIFKSKRSTERLFENLRMQFNVATNPALISKLKELKLI